jgi:hypothetical protein
MANKPKPKRRIELNDGTLLTTEEELERLESTLEPRPLSEVIPLLQQADLQPELLVTLETLPKVGVITYLEDNSEWGVLANISVPIGKEPDLNLQIGTVEKPIGLRKLRSFSLQVADTTLFIAAFLVRDAENSDNLDAVEFTLKKGNLNQDQRRQFEQRRLELLEQFKIDVMTEIKLLLP